MYDSSALRTFTWDENRAGVTDKPEGKRNIDGVSLGGPIKKNKLFFFGNWEGTFERTGFSLRSSVPTADFRSGNFSRMLGAPILSAAGDAHPDSDDRGRHDGAQGRDDLRSLLRQSGRHRPIGLFERRAGQRHPAGPPERAR